MDTTYLEEQIKTIERTMNERQETIDALKSHQDADKKALKAYKESLERIKTVHKDHQREHG